MVTLAAGTTGVHEIDLLAIVLDHGALEVARILVAAISVPDAQSVAKTSLSLAKGGVRGRAVRLQYLGRLPLAVVAGDADTDLVNRD